MQVCGVFYSHEAASQVVLKLSADSGSAAQGKEPIAELRLLRGSHDAPSQLWRALGALASADLITLEVTAPVWLL